MKKPLEIEYYILRDLKVCYTWHTTLWWPHFSCHSNPHRDYSLNVHFKEEKPQKKGGNDIVIWFWLNNVSSSKSMVTWCIRMKNSMYMHHRNRLAKLYYNFLTNPLRCAILLKNCTSCKWLRKTIIKFSEDDLLKNVDIFCKRSCLILTENILSMSQVTLLLSSSIREFSSSLLVLFPTRMPWNSGSPCSLVAIMF